MINPYGGNLIDRVVSEEAFEQRFHAIKGERLTLNRYDFINLVNLATGCYSPLTGFMTEAEYLGVLSEMRLPVGLDWTLPIILTVDDQHFRNIGIDQSLVLQNEQGKVVGILKVSSIFWIDLKVYAKRIFGTLDHQHPGFQQTLNGPLYALVEKSS